MKNDLISRNNTEKLLRTYADEVGCNRGEYELANGILKAVAFLHECENVPAVSCGDWIPCSERLPEDPVPDGFYGLSEIDTYPEYIVMIEGAEIPNILTYMGEGEWYKDGFFYKVAAWMPLPEPYKPHSLN